MADDERIEQTLEFAYKESKDYKIIYANGAYGALTGKGDIKFDLFHEYNPTPEAEVHKVEDGKLGDRISQKGISGNTIIRETLVGVVVTPHIARSIGEWLIRKADEYDDLVEKMQSEEEGESNGNNNG